jgi:adenosylcobinamide-phosphate synthase
MLTLLAIVCGFALDLALGDPRWMPHPVVAMGKLTSWLEARLRPRFSGSPKALVASGAFTVVIVCGASVLVCALALYLCGIVSPWLRFALETFWCYQLLATRELWRQSMDVKRALDAGDLVGAREKVSRIVGRDTARLDREGVIRAAVESVAENASDGVVAPLLYMAVAGAPGAMLYKAINTLDSMIGYRSERYRSFGKVAARTDDVANWLPSRLCALIMIAAATPTGLSSRGAWRIWRRDRKRHASPNSGQSESAMAGALGVRLGGDASYFGELVHKPTLGDPERAVEPEDIARADRLMLATAVGALSVFCALRALAVEVIG